MTQFECFMNAQKKYIRQIARIKNISEIDAIDGYSENFRKRYVRKEVQERIENAQELIGR